MSEKIKKDKIKNPKISQSKTDIEDAEVISETNINKKKENEKINDKKTYLDLSRSKFLIILFFILANLLISFFLFYYFNKKIMNIEETPNFSSSEINKRIKESFEKNAISSDNNIKNMENLLEKRVLNLETKILEYIDIELKKINSVVKNNNENVYSLNVIRDSFKSDLAELESRIEKDFENQKSTFDTIVNELIEKNKKNIVDNKMNGEIYNYQLNFLKETFKNLAREALKLSVLNDTDGSIYDNLKSKIKSLIVVRSLSVQNGKSVDAVLSRAEDQLKKGNILETIEVLNNLPNEEKKLFLEWIFMANALVSNNNW